MKYCETALRFNYTPESIEAICVDEQQRFRERLDAIARTPAEQATFRNTVLELETASTEFANALNAALFLKYVATDDKVRAAADRCETSVQQLMVEVFAREDLFGVIDAARSKAEQLDPVDAFLLEEYIVLFRRNGLGLPHEKRKEFIEKKKRLVALESEFAKRLVEWDDYLAVTREELEGLPESFIDSLTVLPDGKYKLTLSYPHYNPFMENARSASARERLEQKFLNRGGERNKKLLEEALRLRHELARMQGFATHAHYVLDRRMAKAPEAVMQFLDRLRSRLQEQGKRDLQALLEAKREETGDSSAHAVHSHEWRYYENWLRKRRFDIDHQKIKEYFPLNVVLEGMFDTYQRLFGVRFVREPGIVWHNSVEMFRVVRKNETIAYFYTDLFPREGKYGHAAAFTLISGYERADGFYQVPASAIVANFNPPSADTPSLLDHGEVETLFHEFGHIIHQVLTTARYGSLSGTNVKTDFVEAPSQMLENWVWHKEALAKLSGHHKDTSKKLPEDVLERLIGAKLHNVGIRYLRQVSFATIDMRFHLEPDADTTELYHRLSKEIMLIELPSGSLPQASFGHLMGGYDSGYYGYLWSEVYAQDMFTRFEKDGMFNPNVGVEYWKWVLAPGGTRDPGELIRGFLKRPPNEEAFFRSLGL